MDFKEKLTKGKLVRRYKRFLSDIELENGDIVTAHCTNSGSMKTCIEEGAPVYLSRSTNPKRKTRYTWEMIFINNRWIGINTMMPNLLVYEAISEGKIEKLNGYSTIKREVKFHNSRFDIYLENDIEKCFVEVKNVTMKSGNRAVFPDAVTERGRKHLETLAMVKEAGMRAVMVYVIQRMDVHRFGLATDIDPLYAETLNNVIKSGVEVIALQARVSPEGIDIVGELPVDTY